jgi:hypothetical protein
VTTSTSLFAQNATDFLLDPAVLYPLWKYAAFTWAIGMALLFGEAVLARFRGWGLPVRWMAWLYLLSGPLLLAYSYLRHSHSAVLDLSAALVAVLSGWGLAAGLLTWKKRPSAFYFEFAVAFLLFFAIEARVYYTGIYTAFDRENKTDDRVPTSNRPNIYHFLLDTYQTDAFEEILDDSLRESLKGFHYYSNCVTPYRNTSLAIPSTLLGEYYDTSRAVREYIWRAFESPESLPGILRLNGYHTRVFLWANIWTSLCKAVQRFAPFDEVKWTFLGTENSTASKTGSFASENQAGFFSFWVYSNFPLSVSLRLGNKAIVYELDRTIKSNRLDSKSDANFVQPLNTGGTRQILQSEINSRQAFTAVPPRDVYTFIHLYGIHWERNSCFLRADGSVSETTTTLREGARGTLENVLHVVQDLKRNDQFRDALILIHADHGYSSESYVSTPEGNLRSRTLLLVKFPGQDDSIPFQEHKDPVSLLDVAPTVLDAVGVPLSPPMIGYPLTRPDRIPPDRLRFFYSGVEKTKPVPSILEWWIDPVQKNEFSRQIPLYHDSSDWMPPRDGMEPFVSWKENVLRKLGEVQTPIQWHGLWTHYDLIGQPDEELFAKIEERGEALYRQAPRRAPLMEGAELVDFQWERMPAKSLTEKPAFLASCLLRLSGRADLLEDPDLALTLYFRTEEPYRNQLVQSQLDPSGFGLRLQTHPPQVRRNGGYVLLTQVCSVPDVPWRLQAAFEKSGQMMGTRVDLGGVPASSPE